MPIRRAAATPPQDKAPSPAPEEGEGAHAEPSEDSPTVMEVEGGAPDSPLPAEEEGEVGASSKTNGEGAAEEPGSGDVKAELEAENEGHARPTLANGDSIKCQDCAEGQCATHCFVLLKRMKDGGKLGKAKVKKMKKTIPPWASISANKKMAAASGFARATPRVDEVLLEAVKIVAGSTKKKRCEACGPMMDRKTQYTCKQCKKYICNAHTVRLCPSCVV